MGRDEILADVSATKRIRPDDGATLEVLSVDNIMKLRYGGSLFKKLITHN